MAVLPGTVAAPTFDIVVGGHWRTDDEGAFAQLLGVAQDNLRASVVILDRTFDFNHSAFELLNFAYIFRSSGNTTAVKGHALWSSKKVRKVMPLVPSAACGTVPLTHGVVPTCLLASAKQTQACLAVLRAEPTLSL